MRATRIWVTVLAGAMAPLVATGPSLALPPEPPVPSAREPISARVALGCQPGAGFVARVLAQAGERSATRFGLGTGFLAIYRDGSWIHVAEFVEPCVVASGRRADMLTYFEAE